jgi:hypothetical protein
MIEVRVPVVPITVPVTFMPLGDTTSKAARRVLLRDSLFTLGYSGRPLA